tara:strand:+ start:11330 stop:11563 length:234 start_codon:yes stop_codon:yes gene_type:complete
MPSRSGVENSVPKIYQRTALSLMLFGYVTGVRATLHTVTLDQAVNMFIESYGLDEDDYNTESAKNNFNRMQKEFLTK